MNIPDLKIDRMCNDEKIYWFIMEYDITDNFFSLEKFNIYRFISNDNMYITCETGTTVFF